MKQKQKAIFTRYVSYGKTYVRVYMADYHHKILCAMNNVRLSFKPYSAKAMHSLTD